MSVVLFLAGRLMGYLLFGVLAWLTGRMLQKELPEWESWLFAVVYIILAVMLLRYAWHPGHASCTMKSHARWLDRFKRMHLLFPFLGGVLIGVNVCYPFMLAFTTAAEQPNLARSLFFFIFFYLGTSIYLLPLPLLGAFRNKTALRAIGRLSAGLVGLYYLYSSTIIFVEKVTVLWFSGGG